MLFASTRLTLVRELGIERFRETIFATREDELSEEGFKKHDKHNALAAPLTEEEVSLGEVKRKEAEEGRGMAERKSHVSSGVSMPITDEALAALKSLASGDGEKDNLVQLVCFSCFLSCVTKRSTDVNSKLTSRLKLWNLLLQHRPLFRVSQPRFLILHLVIPSIDLLTNTMGRH